MVKYGGKRPLGVGATVVMAMVAGVVSAGLVWTYPWRFGVRTVHTAAHAEVPGPYLDMPSPAEESRLIYSTRTWKSFKHQTSGFVEIFRLADGTRILRLAGLTVPSGAGEGVWLSPQGYTTGEFHTGAISLRALQRADRSASYAIPADADLSRFASVVIADAQGPLSAAPLH